MTMMVVDVVGVVAVVVVVVLCAFITSPLHHFTFSTFASRSHTHANSLSHIPTLARLRGVVLPTSTYLTFFYLYLHKHPP
ncbi:hypothetical protein F4780DRAFT_747409 [Xylariomycetidae sp. FL0641]|nr:hypothetical protein F4780DRAFT_747409 [Xylariomycetidae sp. FL0641]